MDFYKTTDKKEVVLVLDKEVIDNDFVKEILSQIDPNKRLGLDMSHVKTIKSFNFIKHLINDKFRLFNIQSEVLAYLSLVLGGGFLKSYVNQSDFSQNKRELIRRHFLVD